MKIYILTFVDVNNVGYNPKYVEVFKTREEAVKRMIKDYIAKEGGTVNPERDYPNYCDGHSYAYIGFDYYWDIFEKEI